MRYVISPQVIERLKDVLGENGWSNDPARLAPKLVEWRDRWSGTTPFLALPRTTAEVAAVVSLCFEAGVPITPQGGNAGLVGAISLVLDPAGHPIGLVSRAPMKEAAAPAK